TNGTPVVTGVHIHPDYDQNDVIEIVGRIESESMHPLAKAIDDYSKEILQKDHFDVELTTVKTINGKGIVGIVAGESWHIGKKEFATTNHHYFDDIVNQLPNTGETVVYITYENNLIGIIILKD